MAIGTSLGAFHEDSFRAAAAPWFVDEDQLLDDDMVKTPNEVETNKQLDKIEIDPSTGLGIDL